MDKQQGKKLEGFGEGVWAKIHLDSLRAKLNSSNLENTRLYMDTRFKNSLSPTKKLAVVMNKYLQETDIREWLTKGKTTLIQKDPQRRTPPTTTEPLSAYL